MKKTLAALMGALALAATGCGNGDSAGTGGSSGTTSAATSSGSGTSGTTSSGSGSTGASSSGSASSGATGLSGPMVQIVAVDTYYPISNGGTAATQVEDETYAPSDDSVYSVLVPIGDGGYTELIGAVNADGGEFDIPGAPDAGEIFVRRSRQFVETAGRTVDFGFQVIGRPDAPAFSSSSNPAPTDVKLSITGLAPLNNGDAFELFTPNDDGQADYNLPSSLVDDAGNTSFVAGDTTLVGHFDWGTEMANAWGTPYGVVGGVDPVYGIELNLDAPVGSSTVTSYTATHFVDLTGLDVTEGVASAQSATAIPIQGGQPYSVNATRPTALEADLPTGASFYSIAYDIFVSPNAAVPGVPYFGWADLSYGGDPTSGTLVATPSIASPFPSYWPIAGWVNISYALSLEVSASPVITYAVYPGFVTNQVLSGQSLSYAPTIGLVRNLQVDGQSASADVNASSAPTISWTAPQVGTPTQYVLRATKLDVDTTSQTVTPTGRGTVVLAPTTTRFTFPAPGQRGSLPSGTYVFTVSAQVGDGAPERPFYKPTHLDLAELPTHLVTVP